MVGGEEDPNKGIVDSTDTGMKEENKVEQEPTPAIEEVAVLPKQ